MSTKFSLFPVPDDWELLHGHCGLLLPFGGKCSFKILAGEVTCGERISSKIRGRRGYIGIVHKSSKGCITLIVAQEREMCFRKIM